MITFVKAHYKIVIGIFCGAFLRTWPHFPEIKWSQNAFLRAFLQWFTTVFVSKQAQKENVRIEEVLPFVFC